MLDTATNAMYNLGDNAVINDGRFKKIVEEHALWIRAIFAHSTKRLSVHSFVRNVYENVEQDYEGDNDGFHGKRKHPG